MPMNLFMPLQTVQLFCCSSEQEKKNNRISDYSPSLMLISTPYLFPSFLNLYADFRRYTEPVIPVGTPLSKAGGKPENKKRWRWWSLGVPPRPPRFRDTALAKPAEVRDDMYQRPRHQEYQTVAGVPFPPRTGNN